MYMFYTRYVQVYILFERFGTPSLRAQVLLPHCAPGNLEEDGAHSVTATLQGIEGTVFAWLFKRGIQVSSGIVYWYRTAYIVNIMSATYTCLYTYIYYMYTYIHICTHTYLLIKNLQRWSSGAPRDLCCAESQICLWGVHHSFGEFGGIGSASELLFSNTMHMERDRANPKMVTVRFPTPMKRLPKCHRVVAGSRFRILFQTKAHDC